MAQVTHDSFQDTANYTEVTFQYRKDVLDSELNELQKIWRSQLYKGLSTILNSSHAVANANGGLVTSDGVTANTIIIKAGFLTVNGYAIYIGTDITVSGLTTPGTNREDNVYLAITESEINSAVDPVIMVTKLGETSVRKKLSVTFLVDAGSSLPPASGVAPYIGGTQYVLLAHMSRANGVTVIPTTAFVDLRSRSLPVLMAQDRNMMLRATGISWDGTTLSFASLAIRLPGETGYWNIGAMSSAMADGQAFGWLGNTFQDRLRRRNANNATVGAGNAYPAAQNDFAYNVGTFNALAAVGDSQFSHGTFVLGVRDGSTVILRDGTQLQVGDYQHFWGTPSSTMANAETSFRPALVHRAYNGKARAQVDHFGYRGGQISEWDEHWRASTLADWTGATAGVAFVANLPTATFPYSRYISTAAIGAGATQSVAFAPLGIGYFNADSMMVIEGIHQAPTSFSATNAAYANNRMAWGFRMGGVNTWVHMGYLWTAGGALYANLQCTVTGTGTNDDDSGVAITSNGVYRYRIEVTGQNNNSVGSAQARFFINGSLVVTRAFTTSQIVFGSFTPAIRCEAPSGTLGVGVATGTFNWGRMATRFNHLLTPDLV